METRELRTGNFVQVNSELKTVTAIGFEAITSNTNFPYEYHKYNDVEPIPLTEEWLLKFGFEKDGEGINEYWYLNDFEICIHGDRFPVRIWGGESAPHLTQFIGHTTKYVHQLQNIYFALTGEELTIK